MMRKTLMVVALVAAACASAQADVLFVSPNGAGGEIALTNLENTNCPKGELAAFSQAADGEAIAGCWAFFPPNFVAVQWANGETRMYNANGFSIAGK